MKNRRSYSKLSVYIGREYILSFIISFVFFFFIFFVNQILVIAQKIVIKNVEISQVLYLVVLSIPQFLMYTMPFSSLASASMVIGNFSSQNEILAMRSNGIHTNRIFIPIVVISLVFSCLTFLIADKMIPYTSEKYRDLYSEVLEKIPTIELDSYSSLQFGNRILTTGEVEGNTIYDLVIFDNENSDESKIISSSKAQLVLLDIDTLLYRIEMEDPEILINDSMVDSQITCANADEMEIYITLNPNGMTSETTLNPSQMSISQLLTAIEIKREEKDEIEADKLYYMSDYSRTVGDVLLKIDEGSTPQLKELNSLLNNSLSLKNHVNDKNFDFYYQYYRSELYKKIALSLACTCLVFVAFPISFFKVKYGRLVGFGLSMIVACLYWFFIYFMHTRAILSAANPLFYLHLPNLVVLVAGLALLLRLQRQ